MSNHSIWNMGVTQVHINAPYGGISIDMNNMNKILNVYQEDLLVVVQPGCYKKTTK